MAYATRSGPFFFPLLFGCARAGAALVPLDAEAHPSETAGILADCAPKAVFHDEAWAARGADWVPVGPGTGWSGGTAKAPPASAAGPGTPALIIYSSGTTGAPKGIVLTHRNLEAIGLNTSGFFRYRPEQRFLCVLPFFHINAPAVTGMACIAAGAHTVLADPFGFQVARRYWELANRHRVNVLSMTPSIMASLLSLYPDGPPAPAPSVEYGLVGTSHLPETVWRAFEKTFGVPAYQSYGLTEATCWATMTPADERKRYDTVGLPVGCRIRAAGGKTGEVLIKGPIVMKGYYNNPALTRAAVRNGWLRTGDLGYVDRDGQLVITGRIKNVIKRAGVQISPQEIDDALRKHAAVLDVCTVGVPDPVLGEKVVSACVARAESADLAHDLQKFVRERLSASKAPDAFVFVKDLPRNASGKVRLKELRDRLSEKAR